jgi:hypothetical protein
VTGERDTGGTTVRVLDLEGGCVSRAMRFDSLVYGTLMAPDGSLHVSTVATSDRRELGVWSVSPTGGEPRLVIGPPSARIARAVPRELTLELTEDGVRATWCDAEGCETGDSADHRGALMVELPPAPTTADLPMSDPRPVPIYDRWGTWTVLDFRFHGTDTSPSWMRDALLAAAEDATDSSKALSPIFVPVDSGATSGVIRYTPAFPDSCSTAIACASHSSSLWTLRMRPQGHDFRWGTLRWCERTDTAGCFDARHVALHEFGHAIGLDHPEDAGFHLPPNATVMHQVTPARPDAGYARHAFGPCDVASLQEQYSVPTMSTLIPTCNDVGTSISLSASDTALVAGQRVTFRATLRVRYDSAYGELSGIRLNGRSIQLRRRPVGSDGAWTTSWMRPTDSPGVYSLTLAPSRSYEVRAVFPAPADEGLRGATSEDVIVRLSGTPAACTGTCPN